MAIKEYTFKVDFITKNSLCMADVNQEDNAIFNIYLTKKGEAVDLNNQQIRIFVRKPDGKLVVQENNIEVVDAKGGAIRVNANNSMFQAVGVAVGQVDLWGADGHNISSSPFLMEVGEHLGGNAVVESYVDVALFRQLTEYIAEANADILKYKTLFESFVKAGVSLEGLNDIKAYIDNNLAELKSETDEAVSLIPRVDKARTDAEAKRVEVVDTTAKAESKRVELVNTTNSAEAKRVELVNTTNTANASKTALEGATAKADTKKKEVESATANAEAKRKEVVAVTNTANTSKGQLETATANADKKKAEVVSVTADAEKKRAEVVGTTNTANETKKALDGAIASGNSVKAGLDGSISTGNTLKAGLDSDIKTGNSLKAGLESATSSANAKKGEVESATSKAESKRAEVVNATNTANESKKALDGAVASSNGVIKKLSESTSMGAGVIDELDKKTALADNVKTQLETKTNTANGVKSGLDSSIASANTKKGEVDGATNNAEQKRLQLVAVTNTAESKRQELQKVVDSIGGAGVVTAGQLNSALANKLDKNGKVKVSYELTYDNTKACCNTSQIGILSGNNGLGIGLSSEFNSRNGWIQVGHGDDNYAENYGTLRLNPKGGDVWINNNLAMSAKPIGDYYGLCVGTDDGSWIRTPQTGLIPYASGVTSSLGTESWKFADAWIDRLHSRRIELTEYGKTFTMGAGGGDCFLVNSKANAYLQLKDDGRLCYKDSQVAYGNNEISFDQGTGVMTEGRVHLGGNMWLFWGWFGVKLPDATAVTRDYTIPACRRIHSVSVSCYSKDAEFTYGQLGVLSIWSTGFKTRLYNARTGGQHYITYHAIGTI